jgi:hypothetical protein
MGSEGLEFPSKSPNVADTAVDEESLHFKGETAAGITKMIESTK